MLKSVPEELRDRTGAGAAWSCEHSVAAQEKVLLKNVPVLMFRSCCAAQGLKSLHCH